MPKSRILQTERDHTIVKQCLKTFIFMVSLIVAASSRPTFCCFFDNVKAPFLPLLYKLNTLFLPAPNQGLGSLLAAGSWKNSFHCFFHYLYSIQSQQPLEVPQLSFEVACFLQPALNIHAKPRSTEKKFPIRKYALHTKILECQYAAALSQNRKDREKMWAKLRHNVNEKQSCHV